MAGHLTNMKNTADPLATQAGVLAAQMAPEGYEGPVEVIEGKEGFQHVMHNVELKPEILLDGLGEKFMISRVRLQGIPHRGADPPAHLGGAECHAGARPGGGGPGQDPHPDHRPGC